LFEPAHGDAQLIYSARQRGQVEFTGFRTFGPELLSGGNIFASMMAPATIAPAESATVPVIAPRSAAARKRSSDKNKLIVNRSQGKSGTLP